MKIDRLGIMAALPQEQGDLIDAMRVAGNVRTEVIGRREYHVGTAHGVACVVTLARVGKVAAAATASALIHVFGVEAIVFTGVAGGVREDVRVGDIVIGDTLMQHDLDASPLFPRFEVPLLGVARFAANAELSDALAKACTAFLADEHAALEARFGVHPPRLHRGLIVSGDRFVSSHAEVNALRAALPEALAVEMEGAALAQICYEYDVPCAVVRTVSDTADADAPESFLDFLHALGGAYSSGILRRFLAERA
ncbi:S-adenosylhomocysteine nucleosidase [Burkholderia sp. Leaf177]|uniref:5'-methylthioadenosine/adenosylhomocysteine nucleosidase n=1 Tax=Burkholderia sp. Leaf177 TaxID=1736287 RepID=UPI0006FA4156|nr:5'-methylthioadenosine/adenosylhomocysteine nucleosidase [Burkholderia sp. Leaf177]KQR86022.1 S-adenosylhomocysteine nucleosidase [Burkholderia sp. Leaf177]